jgi:cell division protein FtsI/penicillin-binding protein 2
VLGFLFTAALVVGLAYAFDLQVLNRNGFEAKAREQHIDSIIPLAARGRIYDCQGRAVALTRSSFKVVVYPKLLRDSANPKREESLQVRATRVLAGVCGRDPVQVRTDLRAKPHLYVFEPDLNYEVGRRLQDSLRRWRLDFAIAVEPLRTRMYPYGDTLGSVLGFATRDTGRAGLEAVLDQTLAGVPGKLIVQRDALGNRLPFPGYPETPAVNGADVQLAVDLDFQRVVYQELKACVDSFRAEGGSALVMDCRTGEVRAMCDYPYNDPRRGAVAGPDGRGSAARSEGSYRCRAAEEAFEPGSVFKPVIGLAALESRDAARYRSLPYDATRFVELDGYKINDVHALGVVNFPQMFILSSNIAITKLSLLMEREGYFLTMRRLGFGQLTGIELPGEDPGGYDVEYRTAPGRIARVRFANNCFGQGIKVTLLQLASCFAAIGNGGELYRPHLVQDIRSGDSLLYHAAPLRVRRAISAPVAREMTDILARVVTEGTGTSAQSRYFAGAGKTGTAQRAVPGRGYPKDGPTVASFVGFFPREQPEYVVAVRIDNPDQRIARFAGTIVCPYWRRISERCHWLKHSGPDDGAVALNPKVSE